MTQTTPPALSRRQLLSLVAAGAALPLATQPARAQSPAQSPAPSPAQPWPAKPLRVVVAFPPDGLADVLMRHLQAPLQEALGQPLLIDNRGGAAGNLAATEVIRNGGDGHTVLVTVTTTESVNPLLFPKLGFDPQRDLQHVALLANTQLFLATRPTLPPSTVAELVAYAKARPGQLSYGSAGSGTTPHLAGELFNTMAGTRIGHVPYKGSAPMLTDLLGGQVQVAFDNTVIPSIKAGKLRGLAVTGPARLAAVADIPTAAESGLPGYEAVGWMGLYAPKGTPLPVRTRLAADTARAAASPEFVARMEGLGFQARTNSPAEFDAYLRAELQKWARVVKDANVPME